MQLTSPATLREVAKLWTPPTTSVSLSDHDVPQDVEGVLTTVSGVAFTIWRDGPLEGRDRSNTLAKLAHTLASEGIQPGAAFAVLRDADRRWGKFADRPDCDEQLVKFIEAAYPDDPGMGHGPQPSEEAR